MYSPPPSFLKNTIFCWFQLLEDARGNSWKHNIFFFRKEGGEEGTDIIVDSQLISLFGEKPYEELDKKNNP